MDFKSLCCNEALVEGKSKELYCKKCLQPHMVLVVPENFDIESFKEAWKIALNSKYGKVVKG